MQELKSSPSLGQRLATALRRKSARLLLTLSRLLTNGWLRGKRLARVASALMATLVAIGLATTVNLDPVARLIAIPNPAELCLAMAGLLGTIIALVSSLAFLALQRAAETSTPIAVRFYRDDAVTRFVFVALSFFCLASVSLAGFAAGLPANVVLEVQLVVLGASLDLLRLHQRRIADLLSAHRAVRIISKRAQRLMLATARIVTREAALQYRASTGFVPTVDATDRLESHIFRGLVPFQNAVAALVYDLRDTALRAVNNVDAATARSAIGEIAELGVRYLSLRRDNLTIVPTGPLLLASESDLRPVLTPVYESLADIGTAASRAGAESQLTDVADALIRLAGATAGLRSRAFRPSTAPLTFAPLSYLKTLLKNAHGRTLDNTIVMAVGSLADACAATPISIQAADLLEPAIAIISDRATDFFAARNTTLGNEMLRAILRVLHDAQTRGYADFPSLLDRSLDNVRYVVALGAVAERLTGAQIVDAAGSPPYDLTNQDSLAHIVCDAARGIAVDAERPWANPYARFVDLNQHIYRHLRSLVKGGGLGQSLVLNIFLTTKEIAKVYAALRANPVTKNKSDLKPIEGQVAWYGSVCEAVCLGEPEPGELVVEEACDLLAWLALQFADCPKLVESAISGIEQILKHSLEKNLLRKPFAVADVVTEVALISHVAAQQDLPVATHAATRLEAVKELATKADPEIGEALELRRQQMLEGLADLNAPLLDRARDLARQLLHGDRG